MSFKLSNLKHIGLKWKLLIPFIFLPVGLTVAMVALVIYSQNRIILDQEKGRMNQNLLNFKQRLEIQLGLNEALAEMTALNPATQKALADRNREELIALYRQMYIKLKHLPGIKQFHFHLYPERSFLRLHNLDLFGDDLTYRRTIEEAHETKSVVSGLEFGATGFSLRGVAPVYYQEKDVGSVEIGTALDSTLLKRLKKEFSCDFTIYIPETSVPGGFRVLATTIPTQTMMGGYLYRDAMADGNPRFFTVTRGRKHMAFILGRLTGYDNSPMGIVELSRDRSGTIFLIRSHSYVIMGLGFGLLLTALIFVLWVSQKFLAPINTLVTQAGRITNGEQVPQMEIVAWDEFGTLTEAINKMLFRLEQSRLQLEAYAQDLERKVTERTTELVRSEEKFRALMDNIPLVVYRLEKDMIRTFVSPHIEKLTGWPPEELVGPPEVWSKTIHPLDRGRVMGFKQECIEKGEQCEIEYRFQDRQGNEVDVLDYAEPVFDENGRVLYMEGYMLDIRERKRLQEQTLQAEELKTLSEISSRLAHEFRNPLSVIGLSARRLVKALAETGPELPYASIITEQVGRLERIIEMIQTFIQPMPMSPTVVDTGRFLQATIDEGKPFLEKRNIGLEVNIEPDLPSLALDQALTARMLLNLIKNAAYQMPSKGIFQFNARLDGAAVEIRMVYPAGYLSDDHLRHFFYPFTTEDADDSLVDLPLAPVIVHKLGGVINVGRLGDDLVTVTIELPVGAHKEV